MFIEQIYTTCLAQASYYIESKGKAAIIDPIREPEPYLELADQRGAEIQYIFETHFHADFVSGHLDLASKTGAPIIFGPLAETGYDARIGEDGEHFQLGDVHLVLLHTPGHTLESSCYLLRNEEGEDHAIFTGDTLFVGDVGRPDLLDGVATKEELASKMYHSLRDIILPLKDDVLVYPAHGPGSSCGKDLGPNTWSTIGEQRKANYALQEMSQEAFVEILTSDLPAPPPYFFTDAAINKKGYNPVSQVMENNMVALSPDRLNTLMAAGTLVLDTRSAKEFGKGFIKGAINIGLDGMFAIWAGTLIDHKVEIAIVADPGKEEESISRLARVGYENVKGYLEGGFLAWSAAQLPIDDISSVSPDELSNADLPQILDVRRKEEYLSAHINEADNIPLASLESQLDLVSKGPFYLHCKTGYRSMIAASILKKHGITNFMNVTEGMDGIAQTSIPLHR